MRDLNAVHRALQDAFTNEERAALKDFAIMWLPVAQAYPRYATLSTALEKLMLL